MVARPIYDSFRIRLAGTTDFDTVVNLWQQLPGLKLRTDLAVFSHAASERNHAR